MRGFANGLSKVAGHASHRSYEQVSKIVSAERFAAFEAILKKLRKKSLIFRERHQAVADVTRGKDVEFFAKTPTGAAIVGDGDYRSQVADRHGVLRDTGDAGFHYILFQSAQQGRKTSPTAQAHHA